jgi:outer membrane protein
MKTTHISLLAAFLMFPFLILQAQEKPGPAPLALSMRDAIRLALSAQGDPAVAIAAESVRAAEARQREARAGLLPQIDTTVSGQNQILNLSAIGLGSINLPGGVAFPKSSGPFNTVEARVHVRQSVFDWASTSRSRAGRAGIEIAKSETDDARDRVAAQVARLYLAAQRAAAVVGPAEALVASAEATLQATTNQNDAGRALGVEVSHARLRLAVDKQHLLESRMEQTRANMELLSAMNRDLDTPLQLTDPLALTGQDIPRPEQALATALQSRGDVAAQRRKIQQVRLDDSAINSERIPSLAGYADMGSQGTTIANSIGVYDVGISLRIPVFDGGRRNSRREETQAAIRQEELRAAQLERQISLEVRQALIKLDMTRGQVEIADQEIEVARQEVDHRTRRHEQGIGGLVEILEAQTTLAEAIDQRIAAISAWNEGRIELMQAMGTLRGMAQ